MALFVLPDLLLVEVRLGLQQTPQLLDLIFRCTCLGHPPSAPHQPPDRQASLPCSLTCLHPAQMPPSQTERRFSVPGSRQPDMALLSRGRLALRGVRAVCSAPVRLMRTSPRVLAGQGSHIVRWALPARPRDPVRLTRS